jgi:hypothetical protein
MRRRRNRQRRARQIAADLPSPIERCEDLQSNARTEPRDAILLLDVAAQQAGLLIRSIADPASRKLLEDDLRAIGGLLRLARERTLDLADLAFRAP